MAIENTDLERRVLAHERILQALIACVARTEPSTLEQLRAAFSGNHDLGASEQDYTGTEQYADQFMRKVDNMLRSDKA